MTKDNRLVSVGLPTHNREFYLRRAIESVLSQTYGNFEFIISDNASIDGTKALCEEYLKKDARIKYVLQRENIGFYENFNFVFASARGGFFGLLGDDDLWMPTFLERCVEKLEKNPRAVVASTNFSFMHYEDGHKTRHDPRYYLVLEDDLYSRMRHFVLLDMADGKGGPQFIGLWKREMIKDLRVKEEAAGDVNFVLRAISRGACEYVDEELLLKGILPGRKPPRDITISRIIRSFVRRVKRIRPELSNCWFLLRGPKLPFAKRLWLAILNFYVLGRVFVRRKM
jgi:glycosyltransferase involved in cell wall biosynthesis